MTHLNNADHQPSFFPPARYMRTWAFSTVTMPSVMA